MKRIPIVILITALCIGLFLLFDTCSNNSKPLKPDKEIVVNAKNKVVEIDNHYQEAIAQMKAQTDSLTEKLSKAQQQLIATKIKLQQSKVKVIDLVEKDTSSLSIEQKLRDCDTLKFEIRDYVVRVDSTQLNYETTIKQLHQLVAIKDSELVICHVSYVNLRDITNENLNRERQLTHDLETAYKQQRRKQTQSKVLVAGFLILSGITATLFINSKK
jgi:hypothetical protein